MNKIPTLFVRDEQERRYVTTEVSPGCEWVLAGEGTPTRKYDGTCVMYDGERWWARREVKPGKVEPDGFVALSTDENTGKTVGWEPVEQSAFAKWHAQAIDGIAEQEPGTYELVGPKVRFFSTIPLTVSLFTDGSMAYRSLALAFLLAAIANVVDPRLGRWND